MIFETQEAACRAAAQLYERSRIKNKVVPTHDGQWQVVTVVQVGEPLPATTPGVAEMHRELVVDRLKRELLAMEEGTPGWMKVEAFKSSCTNSSIQNLPREVRFLDAPSRTEVALGNFNQKVEKKSEKFLN